jgi:phosphonate transport system substrate-binding protein
MSFYHGSMVRLGKSSAKFTSLPGGINRYARQRCFSSWMPRKSTIVVGAVSYCDSVSSIWEGMKLSFSRRGVELDFILFTTYERQLEYLLSGHIDIAWNGPVAHARLQKLAGNSVSLGMRDVDRDFASCIISTKKSGIKCLKDMENKRLATGSYDSPQAYILPMQHLIHGNVDLSTVEVLRFDKDIGKWCLSSVSSHS